MTQDQDLILDQALQKLSQGESFESILKQFPESESELKSVLKIASLLSTVPKANIPSPTKQYLYNQKLSFAQRFGQLFTVYRTATISAVSILVFISGFGVIQAANNSLPGDTLYPLKLAAEEAQLNLTFGPEKIADLHLALAQKRLDEAKRVIEINDPAQEAAAITALTKQTEKTFSAVSQIATAKALSQNDSRLLDNLVAINKEQKSVLESATKSDNTKQSAEVALSATKETDKSLAKIIAAVNEQTLLDLPNKISVTGVINNFGKNIIVVEKNSFVLNSSTVVIDSTGEIVPAYDKIEGKVTIIGTKTADAVIAKKIIIIDGLASLSSDKPQVKGVVTTIKTDAKSTTTTPTTTLDTQDNTQPQKPSQTQAGFILEPSEGQYAP